MRYIESIYDSYVAFCMKVGVTPLCFELWRSITG